MVMLLSKLAIKSKRRTFVTQNVFKIIPNNGINIDEKKPPLTLLAI